MTRELTLAPVTNDAASPRQQVSAVAMVRLFQVGLWLMVAAGPVVALLAWAEIGEVRQQLTAAAAGSETPPHLDTTAVEGAALVAVGEHLIASGWTATGTAVVAVDELSPDLVMVTVVTDIAPADGEAADEDDMSPRRLFLATAMSLTGDVWAATGPPSVVAGPDVAVLEDQVRRDRLDTAPGLADMVERFVAAYLTGGGELERYTTPEAGIRPVSPPPFTTVAVTDAGVMRPGDGSLLVAVTVEGTDPAGHPLTAAYTLSVVERDGRFEVSRLLPPVPALPPVEGSVREQGGSS